MSTTLTPESETALRTLLAEMILTPEGETVAERTSGPGFVITYPHVLATYEGHATTDEIVDSVRKVLADWEAQWGHSLEILPSYFSDSDTLLIEVIP